MSGRYTGWAGRPCIISTDPASAVAGDYTAISVLSFTGEWHADSAQPIVEVSHLERGQGQHHKIIIDRIKELARWLETEKYTMPPAIIIDANGIGRPIVERAREGFDSNLLLGFIATGSEDGRSDRFDQSTMTIYASKLGHLSNLDAAAQAERLIIPANLKHGPTLEAEARSLRTKLSKSGRILVDEPDSQISQFDDILNSVSMAVSAADMLWTKAMIARMRDHWPDRLTNDVEGPAV